MYDDRRKKCPFNNKITASGARNYAECRETECRFEVDGKCVIIANHEKLVIIEEKLSAILNILRR